MQFFPENCIMHTTSADACNRFMMQVNEQEDLSKYMNTLVICYRLASVLFNLVFCLMAVFQCKQSDKSMKYIILEYLHCTQLYYSIQKHIYRLRPYLPLLTQFSVYNRVCSIKLFKSNFKISKTNFEWIS